MMMKFFALCFSVFNIFYKGFLIKTFWAWFILTQFHSLPRIETAPAIGLALFFQSLSAWKYISSKEMEAYVEIKDGKLAALEPSVFAPYIGIINSAGHFIGTSLLFGLGWILHHFFM